MLAESSKPAPQWHSQLQRAVSELQGLFQGLGPDLPHMQHEDFERLFTGAVKVAEHFDLDPAHRDRHELMNAMTAVLGYAEILRDDVPESMLAIHGALSDVLEAANAATESGSNSPAPGNITAAEPGFILAVDDLQENRELIARYLSRSGHIVVTAASGEEALQALEQTDVDVVLLDLIMPGMDGQEVLHRIKEHPEWRATPVIMISGRKDMDGIVHCIEAGADDYLFKPFNPVLLQARIKAGIERKRWHDREELYRQQLERNEKFIRATFGRYLSDEIVTELLERPEGLKLGGDLREVTIMMSDIRGFTNLCENLEPEQVVSLLNRYLGTMAEIIFDYQGTIDEFLGDAILAVFGAPMQRDDDADRAVQCALDMHAAMNDINAANRLDGLPEISSGIALNTGEVIAGNIGSERRSKYGFVGQPMNLTARIEDLSGRGEILASDRTVQALKDHYHIDQTRNVSLKGFDLPVTIHRILGAVND